MIECPIQPIEAEIVGATIIRAVQKWTMVSPLRHSFACPSVSDRFSIGRPMIDASENRPMSDKIVRNGSETGIFAATFCRLGNFSA